jgi:hypothetical protein
LDKTKNILVITWWSFDDPLIQTYTLPYLRIIREILPEGSNIFLVTLEKKKRTAAAEKNIVHLPLDYHSPGIVAGWKWIRNILSLRKLIKQKNIAYIHTWCTPAGMIGYLLSKMTGKPLVLDSFEPHAEAMVENGSWKKDSFSFKILFRYERKQALHARQIIAAASGMEEYAERKYGLTGKKFFIKPACVDLDQQITRKDPELIKRLGWENKIIGVYAGKFGGIYLEKEVFELFKCAADKWGANFRALILSSHSKEDIQLLAEQAGLPAGHIYHTFVDPGEIFRYIGLADFAITPVKPVPTKRYCTPVKDGEYWAMGLPVIITKNISDDSRIIQEQKIGSILATLDREGYDRSLSEIEELLKEKDLKQRIREVAIKYRSFDIAKSIYKEIYGGTEQ